ncbi:partner of Y14-MAGO [Trifolium repens]|nr:partner of Y14-MAGO [Trifolium repens]
MSSSDRGEYQVKQNQQDEVAIYQPKPALMRKEMASHIGPKGYDPQLDSKPKTKAEKESNLEPTVAEDSIKQEAIAVENVHSLTYQINELAVSGDTSIVTPTTKKIRALKKKVLVLCFI